MKYFALTLLLLVTLNVVKAQSDVPIGVDEPIKTSLENAADTLFKQINADKIDLSTIDKNGRELTVAIIRDLKNRDSSNAVYFINGVYKKGLVSEIYQVSENQYRVNFLFTRTKPGLEPEMQMVFGLIATKINNHFVFAIPLIYLTGKWQTKVVGNITYHYYDVINIERAKAFDASNTRIATKFGLIPQKLDFYLTHNYQATLSMLGYEYDIQNKDNIRDGYGVAGHTIFSVMHNEDFSHDLFHHYSGMIRTNVRNRSAEEGFAYTWGNAYYTDDKGEVITQRRLVLALKAYLTDHPDTTVWQLFSDNPKIFNDIAKEVSVKTTISSLICDEVERKAGIDGVKQLLNCGAGGDDAYFKVVTKLTGITPANFNTEVSKLLKQYR